MDKKYASHSKLMDWKSYSSIVGYRTYILLVIISIHNITKILYLKIHYIEESAEISYENYAIKFMITL